ncbi:MAG: lipid A deacylase LpxR family protein, partial [Desulfovibrionaceae bacterium]
VAADVADALAPDSAAPAPEAEPPLSVNTSQTISLTVENDFFGGGTDKHYTNGLRLAWLSPDLTSYADQAPDWLMPYARLLPFLDGEGVQRNVTLAISQEMYTPADTEAEHLVEEDRPYAGYLAFTWGFVSKTPKQLNSWETSLGVVGPDALGGWAQNNYHQLIKVQKSKGWEYQLHNEPTLNVSWQRIWRALDVDLGQGFGLDVLPHVGASAGTVYTGGGGGGEVRLGWRLPLDFGSSLMRSGAGVSAPAAQDDPRLKQGFGFHFFGGVDGRYVLRNIFLDGNTFQNSHRVDKLPWVGDYYWGCALTAGEWKLTFSEVYRGNEFRHQHRGHTYGSITLAWTF